jgi:hypothetical protein
MKETANTHEKFETLTSRPEQIVYIGHYSTNLDEENSETLLTNNSKPTKSN